MSRASTTSRRCCRLSVRDNGPGIPPEILPKIFQPYFTTKGSAPRHGPRIEHRPTASIKEAHGALHVRTRWAKAPPSLSISRRAAGENARAPRRTPRNIDVGKLESWRAEAAKVASVYRRNVDIDPAGSTFDPECDVVALEALLAPAGFSCPRHLSNRTDAVNEVTAGEFPVAQRLIVERVLSEQTGDNPARVRSMIPVNASHGSDAIARLPAQPQRPAIATARAESSRTLTIKPPTIRTVVESKRFAILPALLCGVQSFKFRKSFFRLQIERRDPPGTLVEHSHVVGIFIRLPGPHKQGATSLALAMVTQLLLEGSPEKSLRQELSESFPFPRYLDSEGSSPLHAILRG